MPSHPFLFLLPVLWVILVQTLSSLIRLHKSLIIEVIVKILLQKTLKMFHRGLKMKMSPPGSDPDI